MFDAADCRYVARRNETSVGSYSCNQAYRQDNAGELTTATKEDIVQCYKVVLQREPESETVVDELFRRGLPLLEIVNAFMNSAEYRIRFKRFSIDKCSEGYLAKSLTHAQKYACFSGNFEFLSRVMPENVFNHILSGQRFELLIPSLVADLSVALHVTHEVENEGELSLTMFQQGNAIYILSFTICSDQIFCKDLERCILISRMQASRQRRTEIAMATKEMDQTTPQACLFYVLVGLANAWGINVIAGVRSEEQMSFGADKAEAFVKIYDLFYKSLEFTRHTDGLYFVRLPLQPKPLSVIKAFHRRRTKRKRAFKARLSEEACRAWTESAC